MEGAILLQIRPYDLCVTVGFDIAHNLAVDMLLGTPFIDRLICEIFPANSKVVPRHSHPVPILSATQHDLYIHMST